MQVIEKILKIELNQSIETVEKLLDLILKIYPFDGITKLRRVCLHILFWCVMFATFWFGLGLPSATTEYKISTAFYFTLLDILFFYSTIGIMFNKKLPDYDKILLTVIFVPVFYLLICFVSYIRVLLIIENNWLSANNNRMYSFINQYYKGGFSYFFNTSDIFTNFYEILSTSLPAFFVKFFRVLAKYYADKKQLEIGFFRLQINPHFLVNTLNNIYSLVILNNKSSSQAIISLSNVLNYVLYESAIPEVTVNQEISFLKDFIELEKIRNTKEVNVSMEVLGELEGKIAPLILIIFIENAFKYGVGDDNLENFIKIKIELIGQILHFNSINTKNSKSIRNNMTLRGVGLLNAKKRLSMLYPQRHTLIIREDLTLYSVNLTIILK